MKFRCIIFLFLMSLTGLVKAQQIEYGVIVDTNYMLIGDQQHLIFKVVSEPGLQIRFPQLKDTVVSGVEIVSGPYRDSIRKSDGRWLYEEKYVITSFDTGVYQIPSMPITLEGKEYNNVLRTEPVYFVVNTFQVDPQKENYDIVLPYDAPWTFAEIFPYILWILLGVVIIGGILWFVWRYKKNKPLFTLKKEEIPPYVIAIRSLDEIKESKLWQTGREKEYYTRLTDTVRKYLDNELGIPAMEQTSVEILQELESCSKVETQERNRIAEMLTTADYVKFAKYTPLQDENTHYLDMAYGFVNVTHQRVQEELSEQQREEEVRQEEEQVKVSQLEERDSQKIDS